MNKFEGLIEELSELLQTPLEAEKGRACKLKINGKMSVYIEHDESKELILLGCFLTEVPPGKYKELLFKETLRINGSEHRGGIFAYSERNNKLVYFTHLPLENLTGEKFFISLERFLDFCDGWRRAVESGNLSDVALAPSTNKLPPMGVK